MATAPSYLAFLLLAQPAKVAAHVAPQKKRKKSRLWPWMIGLPVGLAGLSSVVKGQMTPEELDETLRSLGESKEQGFIDHMQDHGAKLTGEQSPRGVIENLYGEDYYRKALPKAQQYTREHGSPEGWHDPHYGLLERELPVFQEHGPNVAKRTNIGGGGQYSGTTNLTSGFGKSPAGVPVGPYVVPAGITLADPAAVYGVDPTHQQEVTLPHEMTHAYSFPEDVASSQQQHQLPYNEQPLELDARFAHIKREYYQNTGKLITEPAEAGKAWDWYLKQKIKSIFGVEDAQFTPHGDEQHWIDPKNRDLFKQRAPQLVERNADNGSKLAAIALSLLGSL